MRTNFRNEYHSVALNKSRNQTRLLSFFDRMLSSFLVVDVTCSRPMNMQRRRMVRAKFVRRKRKSKSHRLENQRIMNNSEENKELPDSLRKIIDAFQLVPEPAQRYKQLLFLAQKLEPFENVLKVDANKVPGCVSQVLSLRSIYIHYAHLFILCSLRSGYQLMQRKRSFISVQILTHN